MVAKLRLKHEREQRGWSQARVAEQIGTDAVNVSRWERGVSFPSPYFREKLCLLFGKNAQELGFLLEADLNAPRQFDENEQEAFSHKRSQRLHEPHLLPAPPIGLRIVASLSYLLGWGTGLIIFLFCRANRFICFHSVQSLLFFGGVSLWYIAYAGIMSYLPFESVHTIATLISVLVAIIGIVAWLVGIVQALRGKYYPLPFVGGLSLKIAAALARQSDPLTQV